MKKLDISHRIPNLLRERYILDKKKKANRIILYRILIWAFVSQIRTIKISECVRSLVQLRSYLPRKRKFKLKNDKWRFDCSFLYQKWIDREND